jgi:hypothetical protein
MMKFMLISATVICCLAMATGNSASRAVQLQAGSLCENTEKVVFTCTTRTSKVVSLCSSKELTKDRGYLQYRFGLPGKIELEFPKEREQTQAAFKYSHYFRAQFDQTEISFAHDGYEYAVFDDYNGEDKPARHDQGVRITPPNNGKEVTLSCRGKASAQYGDLADVFSEPE